MSTNVTIHDTNIRTLTKLINFTDDSNAVNQEISFKQTDD